MTKLSNVSFPASHSETVRALSERTASVMETAWHMTAVKYEPSLSASEFNNHLANRRNVAQALEDFISGLPTDTGDAAIRDHIERNIFNILQKAGFNPDVYPLPLSHPTRKKDETGINDYSKYLLASSGTKTTAPYCMQIFVFAKGQKTVVHDHPCPCTSVTVKGLSLHRPYAASADGTPIKLKEKRFTRTVGESARVIPGQSDIHSIKAKETDLVTVHFYYMDGLTEEKENSGQANHTRAVRQVFGNLSEAERNRSPSLEMTSSAASFLSDLSFAPKDALIKTTEAFNADTREHKINLGVGTYRDEEGNIPVMKAVLAARTLVAGDMNQAVPYLPIEGLDAFNRAIKTLVFGDDPDLLERIVTVQGIGGTGPIRLAADFLKHTIKNFRPHVTQAWISDPSWPNHKNVFEAADFKVNSYDYYDVTQNKLTVDAMLTTFKKLKPDTVVVLQGNCHNPTGTDLNDQQWDQLINAIKQNNLIPVIDLPYQGFGNGVQEDSVVARKFAAAGITVLVSTSCSKNFGQYGERVGALSIVTPNPDIATKTLSQLKDKAIRPNYSNPPTSGAAIVATILNDPALRTQWEDELRTHRERLVDMRQSFVSEMKRLAPSADFSMVNEQRGMFALLPLAKNQVTALGGFVREG